jgi:hypothetical protein
MFAKKRENNCFKHDIAVFSITCDALAWYTVFRHFFLINQVLNRLSMIEENYVELDLD